jgi:hypothetical protein
MGMFDKPKTVVPAPKKSLKAAKQEIEIAGLEHLAMIDALQDTLKTLRSTMESEVKTKAAQIFAEHIAKTGQRPESFTATEGGALASVQMRRRSSQYPLSDQAEALLRGAGIEPHKEVVTPELFAINPAYANDKALLSKVEKALSKIVPEDFIIMQPEQAKFVVTDDTLNTAIAKKVDASVLQAMTTIACAPKLKTTDLSAILDFVADLIGAEPAFGAAAQEAKEKPKKLRVVK